MTKKWNIEDYSFIPQVSMFNESTVEEARNTEGMLAVGVVNMSLITAG